MKPFGKRKIRLGASRQHWGDGWSWRFSFGLWFNRINYLHAQAGIDIGFLTLEAQWNKPRIRKAVA